MTPKRRDELRGSIVKRIEERDAECERWLRFYDALRDASRAHFPEVPQMFSLTNPTADWWGSLELKQKAILDQLEYDRVLLECLPDEWEAEDMARALHDRATEQVVDAH